MTSNTTFLVTGGNRGLGRGLVEHYLAQPGYTVIAGVRDPNVESSKELAGLPRGTDSSLIVVKIVSESDTDALDAISELKVKHGITKLDIVIANAGISQNFPRVEDLEIPQLQRHLDINLYGVIRLFQATYELLNAADAPKFVTLSTSAACLGGMEKRNFPNSVYGTSKVALNYVTLKMHFENPKLTAFPLDPGWVQTDLGNDGARGLGLEKAEVPVPESVGGMIKVIDSATREKTSGKFMFYDGSLQTW